MTVVSWGGNSHTLPDNRAPKGWGQGATAFLLDLAAKAIPTTGGNQTLTGELNFGATFGVVAPYFKSSSSNIAATGVMRFANNEGLGFRNAANNADLIFKVNASNALEFNGSVIQTAGSKLSDFAATTSAELAGVITDETGTGSLVFAQSPTLVTPILGVAAATSINKLAITAPAVGSTLTIADGKTLTANNTLTFSGTDGSSVAFGAGGTAAYTQNKLSAFAPTTSTELAGVISDETGSGALVFGTSPTLATPIISGAQRLNNVSTPSTPAAGNIEFYSKNDKPTYLDSSGNERIVANTTDSLANPMNTSGDVIYGGASGTATRLAGNTSTTRMMLTQTGSGSASAAPAWSECLATSTLSGTLKPRKGQTTLTFSATPAGWSLIRANGIYYQDQDGNHRLKFEISATMTSVGSSTATITGVTFKNVAGFNQPLRAMTASTMASNCYTGVNNGNVSLDTASAQTLFKVSGDVELESKPSWA